MISIMTYKMTKIKRMQVIPLSETIPFKTSTQVICVKLTLVYSVNTRYIKLSLTITFQ